MLAFAETVGGQGIAHQHHLLRRQPLQQHRHGGGHVHPIGDQADCHIPPQGGSRHRPWCAPVHVGHGVEGVGEHRHPGSEGGVALGFRGRAVAEAHHDSPLGKGGDHGASPLQFRGQGHQIDVAFKAVDAL